MTTDAQFDKHADTYDSDLNEALAASGENRQFFAQGRVEWLARCLRRIKFQPSSAIDYGCGIGDTTELLRDIVGVRLITGLDVSPRSLELARVAHRDASFMSFSEYVPASNVDLVYCNGVFHHIPPAERGAAVDYIYRCLRPGGIFALWENNPWNPGANHVMANCVFDRDAIKLSPPESKRLLGARGFQIVGVTATFLFPRMLRFLRFLEPPLSTLPLGAQYQVLCQRPPN